MSRDKIETSLLKIKDDVCESFSWDFQIPSVSKIRLNEARFSLWGFKFPDLKFTTGCLADVKHWMDVIINVPYVELYVHFPVDADKVCEIRSCKLQLFSSLHESSHDASGPICSIQSRGNLSLDPSNHDVRCRRKDHHNCYYTAWECRWPEDMDKFTIHISVVRYERAEIVPHAHDDIVKAFLLPDGDSHHFDVLEDMFLSKELADCTFICSGNVEIPAHRLILSCKSPVFKQMFHHDMKEAKDGRVILDDTPAPVFTEFLRFLYTARLRDGIDLPLLKELFKLADKYDVPKFKNLCEFYLFKAVTFENAIDMFYLGDTYNGSELKQQALRILKANRGENLSSLEIVKELFMTHPEKLLQILSLREEPEERD